MNQDLKGLVNQLQSVREQAPPNLRPIFQGVIDMIGEGAQHFAELGGKHARLLDAHTSILRRLAFDLAASDGSARYSPEELKSRADQIAGYANQMDELRAKMDARSAEMQEVLWLLHSIS
jgi:hypothetical protein